MSAVERPVLSRPTLSKRGVYWADFTLSGNPVMYGVTSAGEIGALVSVPPGDEHEAAQHVRQKLDVIDPLPACAPEGRPRLWLVPPQAYPAPASGQQSESIPQSP